MANRSLDSRTFLLGALLIMFGSIVWSLWPRSRPAPPGAAPAPAAAPETQSPPPSAPPSDRGAVLSG